MQKLIGIEARSLSHPQPGGYKTYVRNLVTAYKTIETNLDFRLYVERKLDRAQAKELCLEGIQVVTNRIPVLEQVIREQIQLPRVAKRDQCSLIHYTANRGSLIDDPPYVLTLHDIIALTNPQGRLGRDRARLWQWAMSRYDRIIIPKAVKRSLAIITVSEFEKSQIVNYFGIPASKVFVTPLAASSVFRPLVGPELAATYNWIKESLQISPQYFLAIGFEDRKNIWRIICAYSELDQRIRETHKLLIVCARDHVRRNLQRRLSEAKVTDSVKIIGAVDQNHLSLLFNGAVALVFPSLRESFGLPPLEAMACGTPVITANSSSIPEVVGDSALLVNPRDCGEIAGAMKAIVGTPALAKDLRERGLERSREFSWERTAMETLAVYQAVLRE